MKKRMQLLAHALLIQVQIEVCLSKTLLLYHISISNTTGNIFIIKETQTIFREKSESEQQKFDQLFAAAIYLVPLEKSCKIIDEAAQND